LSTKSEIASATEPIVDRELQAHFLAAASAASGWQLTPSVLFGHEAIYDSLEDRMLVENGDDVWAMPLSNPQSWIRLRPSNTPPGSLVAHAYDSNRNRILSIRSQGELWSLSLDSSPEWTKLPTPSPSPTAGILASVYDRVRDRLLVIGNGNEGWILNLGEAS